MEKKERKSRKWVNDRETRTWIQEFKKFKNTHNNSKIIIIIKIIKTITNIKNIHHSLNKKLYTTYLSQVLTSL